MLDRLFPDHPAAVGQRHGEHARAASEAGATLIVTGLACVVHAVFPALFKTGGSDTMRRLNDRLARKRGNDSARNGGWAI